MQILGLILSWTVKFTPLKFRWRVLSRVQHKGADICNSERMELSKTQIFLCRVQKSHGCRTPHLSVQKSYFIMFILFRTGFIQAWVDGNTRILLDRPPRLSLVLCGARGGALLSCARSTGNKQPHLDRDGFVTCLSFFFFPPHQITKVWWTFGPHCGCVLSTVNNAWNNVESARWGQWAEAPTGGFEIYFIKVRLCCCLFVVYFFLWQLATTISVKLEEL